MTTAINWQAVRRVLIVRLRSIGDTVLATPSLIALKRFLPAAEIDILLEDWVAPVLDGFEAADNVLTVGTSTLSRLSIAAYIRRRRYDVVYNLHGGTTAAFLTRAAGAPHRVGFGDYRYSFLHNRRQPSSARFWNRKAVHSAEQQLALLGFTGIPVADAPKTRLAVTAAASASLDHKIEKLADDERSALRKFALLHPAAAFSTKQWPVENFARVAEFLATRGIASVAVASPAEVAVLAALRRASRVRVIAFDQLTLPEITALAARARLFVGNDSGIAHIAAAVQTPAVVVFGSSNRDHWRPWTDAPNEVVFSDYACQPCAGYACAEFGEPRCILSVSAESVFSAIEKVLGQVRREISIKI